MSKQTQERREYICTFQFKHKTGYLKSSKYHIPTVHKPPIGPEIHGMQLGQQL